MNLNERVVSARNGFYPNSFITENLSLFRKPDMEIFDDNGWKLKDNFAHFFIKTYVVGTH